MILIDFCLHIGQNEFVPQIRLDSPLQFIKGVGPRKAEVLQKLGLCQVSDLLLYRPREYLDRTSVVPIGKLSVGQAVTIIGEVKAHGILFGKGRRYEVILQDDSGAVSLVWFRGVSFWQKLFEKGQKFAATGTVGYFQGLQMIHPDLERLEEDAAGMIHAGRIVPVYPQTAELNRVGLNSKGIRRLTSFVTEHLVDSFDDMLPDDVRRSNKLVARHEAIMKLHFPDNRDQIEDCRRRLAFDELLGFQFLVMRRRVHKEKTVKKQVYRPPTDKVKSLVENLPFDLTAGQKKAIGEILADLQTDQPMARMLQGDVGCGKTVVAVVAALYAACNDLQTAFMAPTEILAEQHYRTWSPALAEAGIGCGLITSSTKQSEKKKQAEACSGGRTSVMFGTHALIYDYISFKNLGLVVIDEQHRFGVEQRGKLQAKGDDPDLLAMTATPIPRTMALTLYGDLDISTIRELPPGRLPIRTAWRSKDVRDKVYQFVVEEAAHGGQTYVIYPLIEKSDESDLESVEEAYEHLTAGPFANLRVEMIHGRLKAVRRDEILSRFREGEIDVLLATTVIEVGIDNPNASIMIIEHAERFGLAQLHQLRGRIGRGSAQATLVAIAHQPISDIARQRLECFASTSDGFAIAEADLTLRGPGEIFGFRQSGMPELRTVRFSTDTDLMEAAGALLRHLFDNRADLKPDEARLFRFLVEEASSHKAVLGVG